MYNTNKGLDKLYIHALYCKKNVSMEASPLFTCSRAHTHIHTRALKDSINSSYFYHHKKYMFKK